MKTATWLLIASAFSVETVTFLGAVSKSSDGGTILAWIGMGCLGCFVALAAAIVALVHVLRAPPGRRGDRIPGLVVAVVALLTAPVATFVALLGAAWH